MKLDKQQIKAILQKRFDEDDFKTLKDLPHPYTLKDAQKGALIVAQAIQSHKSILVVGDYDADGTLASVIMMEFFKLLGYDNVEYYIPNRFNDGYGIQIGILQQYSSDLVITVDNGISAIEVGEYCKKHHRKLIITDHHVVQNSLPEADAIINPQQKDCTFAQKDLCGAGVAWYFCNAIKIALQKNFSLLELLKYVAIATIADMMPLLKINKLFVKKGLEILCNSTTIQDNLLKTLLKDQTITAQDIAFYITPLLNSAGRMKDARIVCEFFLSHQYQEIQSYFQTLQNLNQERKKLVHSISLQMQEYLVESQNCVVAYHQEWNEGILGILATKLAKSKQKPAFVFAQKQNFLKGSGRSDGVIDIFQTLLPHQESFIHFGGHSEAVGISIETTKLQWFLDIFNTECPKIVKKQEEVLGEISLQDIDKELLEILQNFQPYGQGNPVPQFIINNIKILKNKIIKDLHQKFQFENGISGIEFFSQEFYQEDTWVHIQFSLQEELCKKNPMLLLKKISRCPL